MKFFSVSAWLLDFDDRKVYLQLPCRPVWNWSTFSTRSRPCNKKNQACKWTSRARLTSALQQQYLQCPIYALCNPMAMTFFFGDKTTNPRKFIYPCTYRRAAAMQTFFRDSVFSYTIHSARPIEGMHESCICFAVVQSSSRAQCQRTENVIASMQLPPIPYGPVAKVFSSQTVFFVCSLLLKKLSCCNLKGN